MNRRDFLLLRSEGQAAVLSCERLYMRFVDAQADRSTTALFDTLTRDLDAARTVRLTDTSWLSSTDFQQQLDAVLSGFIAGGGRVIRG
jgi:hypothetical protein